MVLNALNGFHRQVAAIAGGDAHARAGRQVRSLDAPHRIVEADTAAAFADRLLQRRGAADEALAALVEMRLVARLSPRTDDAPADERGDIEFSGRIKSLDPETRDGVVIVGAKSAGKKIFGMATMNIRFA